MTAVWGSTFFLIRDLVQVIPALDFLSIRFGLAAIVMSVMFWRQLKALTAVDWKHGALIGLCLSAAQILQTIGLAHTSATMSGFVTGLYVVLTPILAAVLLRDRFGGAIWIAVGLSLAGLAVLSLTGDGLVFGLGEWLTLASAVAYAGQIIALGRVSTRENATGIAVVQVIVLGVLATVFATPDGLVLPSNGREWAVIAYMALVAGAGAVWAQTWAQARIAPARAAILMTTEPLFAALFAIVLGGEPFTLRILLGGALIVGAMYVVELGGRRAGPAGSGTVDGGTEGSAQRPLDHPTVIPEI